MNTHSAQEVRFTPSEQLIHDHLKAAAGKVVGRDVLVKLCKGPNQRGTPLSNIVDAHIKNLRAKLVSGSIVSVRGEGYKFVA